MVFFHWHPFGTLRATCDTMAHQKQTNDLWLIVLAWLVALALASVFFLKLKVFIR